MIYLFWDKILSRHMPSNSAKYFIVYMSGGNFKEQV